MENSLRRFGVTKRWGASVALVLLAGFAQGCALDLSRFDVLSRGQAVRVTRHEVADQGAGIISTPGKHSVSKVTLGGSYLRKTGPVIIPTGANSQVTPGLHGNPRATQ